MRQKRKKAALGAILGIVSVLGSVLANTLSAKAQQKQAKNQVNNINEQNRQNRILANQENTSNLMNNVNQMYNNQDYLNSYYDRFNTIGNQMNTQSSLKYGGKRKVKRCGGKKATMGTNKPLTFGQKLDNFNNAGGFSAIGNLASSIISGIGNIKAANILNSAKYENYNPTSYSIQGYNGDTYKNRNNFQDRFLMLKCGGKKKS